MKGNDEPHSISVVRTHVGLSLELENENIWLGSHHSRRSLYCSWIAHQGWISQSDAKGSYGKMKNFKKISGDNVCLPVCCWRSFDRFWKNNYSNLKIRKPYSDTCGVCFQYKLAISKLHHVSNNKRPTYMCMEYDFHRDISHNIPPINMDVDVSTESIDLFAECQNDINSFKESDPLNTFTCPYQDQIEKLEVEMNSHILKYRAQRNHFNKLVLEVQKVMNIM